MHIEIEAKLKVDSLAKVVRRLKTLGAKLECDSVHTDSYFDDAKKSLKKTDSALRIRRRRIGRRVQTVITFKGPKQKGRFKRRIEIQFGVGDAKLAEMLLTAIGYKKVLVFQKRRRVWRLDGCEVALDKLPLLGSFIEIEGPNEKAIARVQEKLELSHLHHIVQSYASLMKRKLRELDSKNSVILL